VKAVMKAAAKGTRKRQVEQRDGGEGGEGGD